MKNFNITVQKFGGSSVADAQKIKRVASFIKSSLDLEVNRRICVVVSAMGHTTNELISLAHQVSKNPEKRELDMLISCGERSSMALLAMALLELGIKAVSLTGSQSGIITNGDHGEAQIIAVRPHRVQDALVSHQVVIIAGFQGVSENREITTLRRGGSDTTAVAMAAALKAETCEIYTDVPGVMDIDPKISRKTTQVFHELGSDRMEAMALYGAKVMAHDAIHLAKALNVNIRVAETGDAHSGTRITNSALEIANDPKLSFTHLRAVVQFSLDVLARPSFSNKSGYFLCGSSRDGKFVGYLSNDIAQELISVGEAGVAAGLALITLHLTENHMALSILVQVTELCKKHGISLIDVLLGHNEVFVVVADYQLSEALAILHAGITIAKDF
ncbi:MAG TPA: aspartate kinase [Myxococcota bacterium]|nr:aspartate kinase [Myxococcota bacterium]